MRATLRVGDGLRMRSKTYPTTGTATDDFVWDAAAGLPSILEDVKTQASVTTTSTFVYGLGLISTTDNAGATSYYLSDGLGSTSQLTNSSGVVTDGYNYDVFGAPKTVTGTTANDFRFTAQQDDSNANRGLYYLRARAYDPSLGRFLQRDPVPFANRYAYAGNNPASFVDPSGLCWGPKSVCNAVSSVKDAATDYAGNVDWTAVALDVGVIGCGGAAVVGVATADPVLAGGGLACQWVLSGLAGAKTVSDATSCKSSPLDFSVGVTNTIAGLNPATAGIASGVSVYYDLLVAPFENDGSTGYLSWCHPEARLRQTTQHQTTQHQNKESK